MRLQPADYQLPTLCNGWSVRSVRAHCGATLTRVAERDVHSSTPADNEKDVVQRRHRPLGDVTDELLRGYDAAAAEIDRVGGKLDGVGGGEWMHGGDAREAVGGPHAYASDGIDLALELVIERSRAMSQPGVEVTIDGVRVSFGNGKLRGHSKCDRETSVGLYGGRRPDRTRYQLAGGATPDLVLGS